MVYDYIQIFYRLFQAWRTQLINIKVSMLVNFRMRNFSALKGFDYIIFEYTCGRCFKLYVNFLQVIPKLDNPFHQ